MNEFSEQPLEVIETWMRQGYKETGNDTRYYFTAKEMKELRNIYRQMTSEG